MPGLGASFGRGGATNFLEDLSKSDCIVIEGSNMAECHPVGFQWVAEAKARLPELIERAAKGEEILLARNGKPRARLVPLADEARTLRQPGKGKGRFKMRRDFDADLPEDVLRSFEGSPTR